MLVSQSSTPNTVSTAMGVQMDARNPVPKLRFEFRMAKLSGAIPPFNYTAMDVKVVVELTPNGLPPRALSAQPEHEQQPSSSWNKMIGPGLVAGAVVLVVETGVDDIFTAGAGTHLMCANRQHLCEGLRLAHLLTVPFTSARYFCEHAGEVNGEGVARVPEELIEVGRRMSMRREARQRRWFP
jgi:hypothetical protein